LFGIPKFKGNPTQKHVAVDQSLPEGIQQQHFDQWVQLWFDTIDELYHGLAAERAKMSAKKMSMAQFSSVLYYREN
jgi:hemoglobin